MSRLKEKIRRLFCVKINKRALKNSIIAYRPVSLFISKTAKISVNRLRFNSQWDDERQCRNKLPGTLFIDTGATFIAEDFTCYAGCRITVNKNANLSLQTGFLSHESVIECFEYISIGSECVISERVIIRDSNNHMIHKEGYLKTAPINIGNHVWIGMGAMILPGVTVGDGAVVAAGAIVNKDVPPKTLVAGVPAKVIRENVEWN